MHLQLAAHVHNGVRVGGFQRIAILGDDRGVPVDQFLRRTLRFGVVAIEDLHDLNGSIVDGRRAIEDDVPYA